MMISDNYAVCYTDIKYGFPTCSYNNINQMILLCYLNVFVCDSQWKEGDQDRTTVQDQEQPGE